MHVVELVKPLEEENDSWFFNAPNDALNGKSPLGILGILLVTIIKGKGPVNELAKLFSHE
jgi:hypothetical protein